MAQSRKTLLKYSMATPLVVGLILISGANGAMALPQGNSLQAGNATVSTSGKTMTVTQTSDRAIINWTGFDVGSKETVTFDQQKGSSSVILNRVNSKYESNINGAVNANGTVMIINTHGVVFGDKANVNVGGLVATSSDIDNTKFMAGDYSFSKAGDADAWIINNGKITVDDGGLVAMAGPNVQNTGIINAKLGKVQLGSGDTFSIDLYGDGLIKLQASDKIKQQLVENEGQIYADGGSVLMTAAAAQKAIDSVVNMDGLIQADSVAEKNGKIVLTADKGQVELSGTVNARGNKTGENGGTVTVSGKRLYVDGTVNAGSKSAKAGSVTMTAQSDVVVRGAVGLASLIAPFSVVTSGALSDMLNTGTNVNVYAKNKGSIEIATDIAKTKGGNANLAMDAQGNLAIDSGVDIYSTSGALDLSLKAAQTLSSDIWTSLSTKGGSVDLEGADVVMGGTFGPLGPIAIATAGGDLTIKASTGDVALYATSIATAGGDVYVSGNDVTAWGYSYGDIATKGGDLTLSAKDFLSVHDTVLTAGAGKTLLTGPYIALANATVGDKDTTGTIKFVADSLSLNDCAHCTLSGPTKVQTASSVTFETFSKNKSIGVAGAAGDLQLSTDLLDRVKADTIIVGALTKGTGITANDYTWKSNVEMLTQAGAVALYGMQDVGAKTFFAESVTGDIQIGRDIKTLKDAKVLKNGGIKSTAEGTAVTLVAGGKFVNAGGASAISTKNGRWLIYSVDPNFDTMGGLVSDFHRYSCTFGGSCPSFPTSGNGNLYSVTPYLTVLAKDTTTTYGQAATYDYMIIGYRAGDLPLDVVSLKDAGKPAVVYSTSYDTAYALSRHAGMYALNVVSADNLLSSLGYGFKTDKTSPGMITVNKAALTVVIDDKNKTYGQVDPALTYNVSGLQYNDTKSVVGDLTRAPGENVIPGGYAINVASGLVMQNYVIDPVTYKSGTLTIDKAALTVLIDDKSKTYGQVDPELTYQVSGLQFSDTKEDVIGSLVRAPGEHVVLGGYAIGVDPARLIQNYYINLETSKDGVLTINKASLSVQADNKSMTYQTSVPALTYTYDPAAFQNGDTASVFTGGLTTVATNTSLPGVYAILGGTLSAGGDYDLTVLPGQLTVTADTSGVSDVVAQGKASAALSRQPYTGVLLAMSTMPRGALGNLAPAAGGAQGAALTPAQLADLAPAAGGNGPAANGGVVSLIECGVDTPCQLNW